MLLVLILAEIEERSVAPPDEDQTGSGFYILSHMFGVGSFQYQNWPVARPMTVWPSGLRRWLQAPVR